LLLETKDSYTLNHSRGVAELCLSLGKRLGITELDLFQIWTAALFHDVGKIAVPDSILLKRGRLTDREFDTVSYPTAKAGGLQLEAASGPTDEGPSASVSK